MPGGLGLSLGLAQEGTEGAEMGRVMGLWLRESFPDA